MYTQILQLHASVWPTEETLPYQPAHKVHTLPQGNKRITSTPTLSSSKFGSFTHLISRKLRLDLKYSLIAFGLNWFMH